jgi:hypothetical protein
MNQTENEPPADCSDTAHPKGIEHSQLCSDARIGFVFKLEYSVKTQPSLGYYHDLTQFVVAKDENHAAQTLELYHAGAGERVEAVKSTKLGPCIMWPKTEPAT